MARPKVNEIPVNQTVSKYPIAPEISADGRGRVLTSQGVIAMAEPKAKQLLLTQSWAKSAPVELQSDEFAGIYLIWLCCQFESEEGALLEKPDFEAFLDGLSIRDMQEVGQLLNFFPDFVGDVAKLTKG